MREVVLFLFVAACSSRPLELPDAAAVTDLAVADLTDLNLPDLAKPVSIADLATGPCVGDGGVLLASRNFTAGGAVIAGALSVNAAGDVAMSGLLQLGAIAFGQIVIDSPDGATAEEFVGRLDADGGATGWSGATDVVLDSRGNSYDFSYPRAWFTSRDPQGQPRWQQPIGFDDSLLSVAPDDSLRLVLLTTGDTTLGATAISATKGLVVAALENDGSVRALQTFELGPLPDTLAAWLFLYTTAIDPQGRLLLSGVALTAITIGGAFVSHGAFILRFDLAGAPVVLSSGQLDGEIFLASNRTGKWLEVRRHWVSWDHGSLELTVHDAQDHFPLHRSYAVDGYFGDLASVALDDSGAAVWLGDFEGTLHLGRETLVNPVRAGFDQHWGLFRLDPEGNIRWAKTLPSRREVDLDFLHPRLVDTDGAGNVYVAPYFEMALDLCSGAIASPVKDDFYTFSLLEFSP